MSMLQGHVHLHAKIDRLLTSSSTTTLFIAFLSIELATDSSDSFTNPCIFKNGKRDCSHGFSMTVR